MTVLFFLLLLAAAGVVMGRRSGRVIVAVAIAAMFVWGSDVAASRFAGLLERGFAAGAPAGDADAIVVLGASTYPPDDTQPEILPGYGTYLRCHHAARLYRTWKALPVVATGGPVASRGTRVDATAAMRSVLESEGVPPGMVWIDRESANTRENALHTAALLRRKGLTRVALVTEALHMRRSRWEFEQQGLTVLPAPCAFRAARFEGTWREYLWPRAENMVASQQALHEVLGLAWRRLGGS